MRALVLATALATAFVADGGRDGSGRKYDWWDCRYRFYTTDCPPLVAKGSRGRSFPVGTQQPAVLLWCELKGGEQYGERFVEGSCACKLNNDWK